MSERKIVEAFKTYFEKSLAPYVQQNEEIMREWNHLNKIISSDPIDYSQIEFYLLLSNKNNGSKNNIPSNKAIEGYKPNDFNLTQQEKKGSFVSNQSSKKKNLVSNLQSFQKMLLYNQERLQGLNRREGPIPTQGMNTSSNGISMRRY